MNQSPFARILNNRFTFRFAPIRRPCGEADHNVYAGEYSIQCGSAPRLVLLADVGVLVVHEGSSRSAVSRALELDVRAPYNRIGICCASRFPPITSDFTIEVDREAGSRLKRAVAVISDGGQTVRLTSENGAVRLGAVIVPEGSGGE
jgi:hypothetical protein